MKIVCPSCRVPVAADDVAADTGLARCRTCNHVFRPGGDAALAEPAAPPRPTARKPRSVATSDAAGELTVKYRWFSPDYLFLAFFCVIWDGFLVSWYASVLPRGEWAPLLAPLLLVAVGIVITYSTLAHFVNTTTLRIDGSRLRVTHHPLPWWRPVELEVGDVQQLFCDRRSSRGLDSPAYTYTLNALLRDGTRLKVVTGVDSAALPLYLEQHAEAWMGIRDEPVAGELPR
jgi:predicted Zn finger-like uncharacterized protein